MVQGVEGHNLRLNDAIPSIPQAVQPVHSKPQVVQVYGGESNISVTYIALGMLTHP